MIAEDTPSTVTGMRGMITGTVSFHGPDLDLHSGVFGGAVPEPGHRDRPAGRQAARRHRPGHHPRLLRRRPRAHRRGARPVRQGAGRRRRVPLRRAVARPARRGRLLDPGADRRPADRRGQRHRRRLPGRRAQDDRPERRVRQAQLPARRRPGPGQDHSRASSSSSPTTRRTASTSRSSGRAAASAPAWCRWARPRTPR